MQAPSFRLLALLMARAVISVAVIGAVWFSLGGISHIFAEFGVFSFIMCMIQFRRLSGILCVLALCGCEPTDVETVDDEVGLPTSRETEVAAPEEEPELATVESAPLVEVSDSVGEVAEPSTKDPFTVRKDYVVLTEPWKRFFRNAPKVLIVRNPSKGIQALLAEEQSLIKTVLDANAKSGESSQYAELTEKLDELKTIIPSAETASGYVRGNGYRRYTYVSGGTIYTRTGGYYYDGYRYGILRAKQKSSSPELVRSVQSLVHNASLDVDDLNQRIQALQKLISQWSRRTSEMSLNGTAGIIRDANEAYLDVLRAFTTDFIELRSEVSEAEAIQVSQQANKSQILSDWKVFEETRLNILKEYLEANAEEAIFGDSEGVYTMPELNRSTHTILVCTMGDRDLYFEVGNERDELHPFVFVDISAQPE